ncbi:MAG: hypothetical protein KGI67_02935 [Pseudomonadota bacterium]|nr:hypothetical protein [Pseudomonadota bacterium]
MFRWFSRFTRAPTSPPGLERRILRQLPAAVLLGGVAIALPSLLLRLAAHLYPAIDHDRLIQTTDYLAIGVFAFHLTSMITLAIGAFVVVVMKGPVHTADPYPLSDADRPPSDPPKPPDRP